MLREFVVLLEIKTLRNNMFWPITGHHQVSSKNYAVRVLIQFVQSHIGVEISSPTKNQETKKPVDTPTPQGLSRRHRTMQHPPPVQL